MAEKSEEKKKAGKLVMKMIIISIAVVVMAGAGFFVWAKFIRAPEDGAAARQAAEEAKSASELSNGFGQTFPMDVFVVNLSDPGGKRYLKTKIELEFADPLLKQELSARLPQLRDCILLILSSKRLDEIQNVDGKIMLRNELIMKLNQLLQQGEVKNLFFTEFVVQ